MAAYADNYFEYDSSQRVTKEVAQGEGCSVCTGGTADPSTLSFSIGNRSINDFMPNMGGVFFTADIFGGALGAQGDPIFRVGSDRRVFDPVPEPTFYLALAVGVGALFFTAKRKASSKQS